MVIYRSNQQLGRQDMGGGKKTVMAVPASTYSKNKTTMSDTERTGFYQLIPQSFDERKEMYRKMDKERIIEMLLENQRLIENLINTSRKRAVSQEVWVIVDDTGDIDHPLSHRSDGTFTPPTDTQMEDKP